MGLLLQMSKPNPPSGRNSALSAKKRPLGVLGELELGGVAAGAGALRVRVVDREAGLLESIDVVDRGAAKVGGAHLVDPHLEPVGVRDEVVVELTVVEE